MVSNLGRWSEHAGNRQQNPGDWLNDYRQRVYSTLIFPFCGSAEKSKRNSPYLELWTFLGSSRFLCLFHTIQWQGVDGQLSRDFSKTTSIPWALDCAPEEQSAMSNAGLKKSPWAHKREKQAMTAKVVTHNPSKKWGCVIEVISASITKSWDFLVVMAEWSFRVTTCKEIAVSRRVCLRDDCCSRDGAWTVSFIFTVFS